MHGFVCVSLFYYYYHYYYYTASDFHECELRPLLGERLGYALSNNALPLAPWWLKHFKMRSNIEEQEDMIVEVSACLLVRNVVRVYVSTCIHR